MNLPCSLLGLSINERREIFQLRKQISELESLVQVLGTKKKYISQDRRNVLINALKFCHRHSLGIPEIDLRDTIEILRESNQIPLDSAFRAQVFQQITKLMENFGDFERIIPQNDEERFDLMLEGRFLFEIYSQDLLDVGIVSVQGLTCDRKLKLAGTLPPGDFYSQVTSRWQFDNPSKHFLYSQVQAPPVVPGTG